jgi:hypothetical protein
VLGPQAFFSPFSIKAYLSCISSAVQAHLLLKKKLTGTLWQTKRVAAHPDIGFPKQLSAYPLFSFSGAELSTETL